MNRFSTIWMKRTGNNNQSSGCKNGIKAGCEEYILILLILRVMLTLIIRVSKYSCLQAILVVDSSQGIQAQTLANVYLALENDLEIMPVINKIDLPGARPRNNS